MKKISNTYVILAQMYKGVFYNMKKYVSKITANTSLYEKLKSVVPDPANDLDTHESDIYVLKTPETEKIIKKYFDDMGIRDQSTVFIDNISNRPFYEVPFGYMNEFVEKRRIKSSTVSKKRCITASSSLTADEMWDYLLDMGVSEETLQVVTDINGYSEDTMRDILYAVSGYRDFDQLDD